MLNITTEPSKRTGAGQPLHRKRFLWNGMCWKSCGCGWTVRWKPCMV